MSIQDIRTGVTLALVQDAEDHDVDGIVEEIGTRYGYDLQSVNQVPTEEFWAIVQRHALTQDPVPDVAQARMDRAVREAATMDRQGRRLT